MQGGLCCYMNHRQDCSEVNELTGVNTAASSSAVTVALLWQGGPGGDLEQIDCYLEALLKEDNLLLGNTSNRGTAHTEHSLPLEKK